MNNSRELSIDSSKTEDVSSTDLIKITEDMLLEASTLLKKENNLVLPISELAILGSGFSSIIPALRTVTTTIESPQGLYKVANMVPGGQLQKTKSGAIYGSIRKPGISPVMAKWEEAGNMTQSTTLPIDPTTIMMAVALASIEQQLKEISKVQKEILEFLEIEKESAIEADIETLVDIISKFKYNWDNEQFLSSNHKMVLDIQRSSRQHMISFTKKVTNLLGVNKRLVTQSDVNDIFKDFQKKYMYYKLSLHSYSLASMVEIMLSKNYSDENVNKTINELTLQSSKYRDLFTQGSIYLEKMSNKSLDSAFIHGIGVFGKGTGKVIEKIPFVSKSQFDEKLIDSGDNLKKKSSEMRIEHINNFSSLSNPGTNIFTDKLKDIVHIYNDSSMYVDSENIYMIDDRDILENK